MAIQGMTPARPLPYDLLRTVISELGAEIREVAVTDLSQEIFYARIVLAVNGRRIEIDSRPSDAIALAVRAKVPIYVDESVMERAGVRLESEEETESEGELEPPEIERVESEESISEADLSVFREVIESLDLDDLDKK